MSDSQDAATKALTTIIGALTPLSSEERSRIVNAAMMFFGEPIATAKQKVASGGKEEKADETLDDGRPVHVSQWMKQNGVSVDELDQVFHFGEDESYELLDAPGSTKKEQTLNTYILTGLGKYLATRERTFDDATARAFCDRFGCYDQANHSVYLKARGPEFTGDKNKGFSLTNPGIKRGGALVKEVASGRQ